MKYPKRYNVCCVISKLSIKGPLVNWKSLLYPEYKEVIISVTLKQCEFTTCALAVLVQTSWILFVALNLTHHKIHQEEKIIKFRYRK